MKHASSATSSNGSMRTSMTNPVESAQAALEETMRREGMSADCPVQGCRDGWAAIKAFALAVHIEACSKFNGPIPCSPHWYCETALQYKELT